MPKLNPEILRWARETAGLSLEAAARAIDLHDARGQSGPDRLAALERGDDDPSAALLQRMADKYRRPLITFYLRAPPRRSDLGEDFRRAPGSAGADFNPRLDTLLRTVRARHNLVAGLLEDEEAPRLSFVASMTMEAGEVAVAEAIRNTIAFDLAAYRRSNTATGPFAYLRERLERVGLFVVLLGDLGSPQSKIDAKAFRGYAIADPIAPFIVINDNDAATAWSFTALHEAAHIWLGQTGVSGPSYLARVERFCNDVAGRLLLPPEELQAFQAADLSDLDRAIAVITAFAAPRRISRRMVAYALLRDRRLTSARYDQLVDHFYGAWLKSKEKDPDLPDEGRGPSRYMVLRHRLGPALVGLARRAVDAGDLSQARAARLLGVKPGSVRKLLNPKRAVS